MHSLWYPVATDWPQIEQGIYFAPRNYAPFEATPDDILRTS
jgi:hypothetical protein